MRITYDGISLEELAGEEKRKKRMQRKTFTVDSAKAGLLLELSSWDERKHIAIEPGETVRFVLSDGSEVRGVFRWIEAAWPADEDVAVVETDEDVCRIGLSDIVTYIEAPTEIVAEEG